MTAEGKPRPTQVTIIQGEKTKTLDLPDEQAELDFVRGIHPVKYREITEEDELANFRDYQVRWKGISAEEVPQHPQKFVRPIERARKILLGFKHDFEIATHVPIRFEGLEKDDIVGMVLGGSGDALAFAISRCGEQKGFEIFRIPPARLKEERGTRDKNDDHELLATLVKEKREIFYRVDPVERSLILVSARFQDRMDAMKSRIACQQRLRQRFNGRIFMNEEGYYPEGSILDACEAAVANNERLALLQADEDECYKALAEAVEGTAIYTAVLSSITGVGPRIAGGLIAAVQNIKRFPNAAAFASYCGVRPRADGSFPHRQVGKIANWSGDARQSLYQLAMQASKRPGTQWGDRLRELIAELRTQRPDILCRECAEILQIPDDSAHNGHWLRGGWRRHDDPTQPRGYRLERLDRVFGWNDGNVVMLEIMDSTRERGWRSATKADEHWKLPDSMKQWRAPHDWEHRFIERISSPGAKNGWRDAMRDDVIDYDRGIRYRHPFPNETPPFLPAPYRLYKKKFDCADKGHHEMYTDGHIRRQAIWYMLGEFATWLFKEWKRIDEQQLVTV